MPAASRVSSRREARRRGRTSLHLQPGVLGTPLPAAPEPGEPGGDATSSVGMPPRAGPAGQAQGRSRQGPHCAAQAHLHQPRRKATGLQRCGLGQSELIQTGLFLPKIRSRHRQGKGGRCPPAPPTYRLAHAVEAWRTGGQGRWWERKRKCEQTGKKKIKSEKQTKKTTQHRAHVSAEAGTRAVPATARSQTRARRWALPRRHALKHRLRPSLHRVTATGSQRFPLAPLRHPHKGTCWGGCLTGRLDATQSPGEPAPPLRHLCWCTGTCSPGQSPSCVSPGTPSSGPINLSRCRGPRAPPKDRCGAPHGAFPPPAVPQGAGQPFPELLLRCSGGTVAVPAPPSSSSSFPPQNVPVDGSHRLVGAATPRGAPPGWD